MVCCGNGPWQERGPQRGGQGGGNAGTEEWTMGPWMIDRVREFLQERRCQESKAVLGSVVALVTWCAVLYVIRALGKVFPPICLGGVESVTAAILNFR